MIRFKTLASVLLAGLCLCAEWPAGNALAAPTIIAPPQGRFADINGQSMYYERFGTGRPLVLLHGGGSSIRGSFGNQLALFATTREIIAVEQAGHGHTPDSTAPFSYAQMADDTAALLRSLHIADADIIGWSDGGILALLIAQRHPDLVRRLVASGANIRLVGLTPQEIQKLRESSPEQLADEIGVGAREEYAAVSPDGADHWPTVAKKLWDLWLTPVILDAKDLALISAPALIISGDRDLIPVEHAMEIFRALPNGRLLVLPGTGHDTFSSAAGTVNAAILSFFNEP